MSSTHHRNNKCINIVGGSYEEQLKAIGEIQKEIINYNDDNVRGFKLPIKIHTDNCYLPKLEETLNAYYKYLSQNKAFQDKDLLKEIDKVNKNIIKSIKCYYEGKIIDSIELIKTILNYYSKNQFFLSELDKNYAFRSGAPFYDLISENGTDIDYKEMNECELSFFKARTEDVYERKEMLHIPLNRRELISTQRFSIPGIPCVYLGTTSYVCWLELNKPNDKSFNVSSYKFNDKGKKLRILNLVIPQELISGIYDKGMDNYKSIRKRLQIDMLRLWPLVCATSFNVNDKNRSFKSEYIVSQLIMLCLKELKIDGIAYISKKCEDDSNHVHLVNLALPVFDLFDTNKEYGKLCDYLELTRAYNFSSFIESKSVQNNKKSYVNQIYNNGKINCNNGIISYNNTQFSHFDNYLVNREHKSLNNVG